MEIWDPVIPMQIFHSVRAALNQKTKIKKIVDSIVVDKSTLKQSGIGATTLNDGLVFGNYPYGTRSSG